MYILGAILHYKFKSLLVHNTDIHTHKIQNKHHFQGKIHRLALSKHAHFASVTLMNNLPKMFNDIPEVTILSKLKTKSLLFTQ